MPSSGKLAEVQGMGVKKSLFGAFKVRPDLEPEIKACRAFQK